MIITRFGILFKKKGNDFRSNWVSMALKSDIVHCEIIFSDGTKGASWYNYVGVGVFPQTVVGAPYYFIKLPNEYEAKTREWFELHKGASYNWAGIFGGMIKDLGITGKGYNCNDSCIYALKYAGMPLPEITIAEIIKPADLYQIIKEKYT